MSCSSTYTACVHDMRASSSDRKQTLGADLTLSLSLFLSLSQVRPGTGLKRVARSPMLVGHSQEPCNAQPLTVLGLQTCLTSWSVV